MPNTKNIQNLESLKDKLAQAKSTAIVDYQGVSVNDMTELRRQLRESGGEFLVTKNTIISLAFDKNETIKSDLEGMNGLVLSFNDEVSALKVVFEFQKNKEKLTIKSGSLNGKVVSASEIEALSKLPGKNELIATLINRIQSPAYGLVNVLQAGPRNLVYALQAIATKEA